MTTISPDAPRSRRRIDGWRWSGRVFLVFMLLYTAVPMVWMLITSIKSGFAAMQFPPQWWPTEPTLASYQKLLDPQNSVGRDFLRFFWNSLFVSFITTILAKGGGQVHGDSLWRGGVMLGRILARCKIHYL